MNYKAYHGSNVEIKEFDPAFTGKGNDQYGSGFYFATNKEAATAYGDKITKAIITFENPFILDGNKEPNLDNVFPKNNDEIYRILLHMPSLFNSPEDEEMNPLGDYFAGPNHVLPTNGTAKFFSALSVDDFVKKSSIVYYSREALKEIHRDIIQFATSEQLTAHANSIAVRFEDED